MSARIWFGLPSYEKNFLLLSSNTEQSFIDNAKVRVISDARILLLTFLPSAKGAGTRRILGGGSGA